VSLYILILFFIEDILVKYHITCNNYLIKYGDLDLIYIRYNVFN
jgi:hypothetical protein